MENNEEGQIQSDRQDSIKVNKTTTGKYSFEVKRYYNRIETEPNTVINDIKNIYIELGEKFKEE